MKLTAIFLFAACLQVSAAGYSQKVTLSQNNVSLKKVFKEIENQSGYHFFYKDRLLRQAENVSINVKGASVEEVLDECLKEQALSYTILDKIIVIKAKKIAPSITPSTIPAAPLNIIRGTVKDEKGAPLAGVSVIVKGTQKGTSSGTDGSFSIDANVGNVLEFTIVGYQKKIVSVGNQTEINVVLELDVSGLSDVVVVGYGTQKKVNLTGAISVVNAKDLEDRPLTNASQALQGVNGIYVNQAGGQPGADDATIRIRGIGTIGSAGKLDPLVLVDGAESSLRDVNPNDIDNISVLKDAASTAIYGSRAANGVILVTTKMGKLNERPTIEYNGYVGIQSPTYLPDPVDSSAVFMEWYNKAQINQGSVPYYSDSLIQLFRDNPTSVLYPNTNWMDVMFGPAFMQAHNLRFSGGSQKTRYSLSTEYLDQDGVLKGMTAAKKYGLNMRINSDISNRFGIDGSIKVDRWDREQPSDGISVAMNRIMRMVPIQPEGKLPNGDWADSWVLTPGQNSFQDPRVFSEVYSGKVTSNNVLLNLGAHYNILKNLRYEARGFVNYLNSVEDDFATVVWLHDVRTGEPTRNPYTSTGYRKNISTTDERMNFTHTIVSENNFKNHNLKILFGNSFEQFKTSNFNANRTGYETPEISEISSGTIGQFATGGSNKDILISYFGRINYSYKDKYLFEANARYDGSSRFAKTNRWGLFPSFSAGWRISEESFMKNLTWINQLKIRASWGQIGNQEIGRFQYVNVVNLGYGYPFGGVYSGSGSAITQSRDPNIRWETTTMTDIGLDWSLFDNRIYGEFDYFYKRTDGILRQIALPSQVGDLAGPTTNLAVVDNTGFEISLNYRDHIGKDFSYNIGGSFGYVKNNVVNLNGEEILSGGTITKEGAPIESWYVLEVDGIFQSEDEVKNYPTISSRVGPGDLKYVDRNNDGKIDGDDRYIAGKTFPPYTFSFNIDLNYKSFSLTTLWQGVSGLFVRPNNNMASPYNNGAGVQKEWITDSWTPERPNARLPRISTKNRYLAENFSDSDFWLRDASYLRLKNIQLSYKLNNSFINKIGLTRASIFINAQNILTFTKFKDYDPERNILAQNFETYPSIKIVTGGINIKF
jgi:TonB-linked SusC/RagA family outer membrane protein